MHFSPKYETAALRRLEEPSSRGHLPYAACLNQAKALNTNFPKEPHRNGREVDPTMMSMFTPSKNQNIFPKNAYL